MQNIKNQKGFTLIELLVVVVIIGVLSAWAIYALSNARVKSRDAKRVADMRQLVSALDLYYNDSGIYPTSVNPGNSLTYGSTTYLAVVPSNPTPNNDGNCPANTNYSYSSGDNTSYTISYCLGASIGDLSAGAHHATPNGLNN